MADTANRAGSAWLMMNAETETSGVIMFVSAAFLMATAMALDGLDGNRKQGPLGR